jgi:hypothetical protein
MMNFNTKTKISSFIKYPETAKLSCKQITDSFKLSQNDELSVKKL